MHAVVLKLAAHCNLNCEYCYVYNHEDKGFLDRPRFISDEVFDATLKAIADYCDRRAPHSMFLTMHGGEPMLVGPRRFDELVDRAERTLGDRLAAVLVQSNGTLLSQEWLEVFASHSVSLGISLDGPREIHDATRVNHAGRGSYDAVARGIALLQEFGIKPSILCVVNPRFDGLTVYRHLRDLGIERMNFLLPDCSHDTKERWYGGLGETPVADYLIPIFDEWVAEDESAVTIRLFWGLLRKLMGGEGETDQFGNAPMSYVVVETDGSIEALDALRVCGSGLAVSGLNVLHDSFDDLARGSALLHRAVTEGFAVCEQCRSCAELEVCGGGYLPHRYAQANGFDNPSVWCKDILKLMRHMREWLARQKQPELVPA